MNETLAQQKAIDLAKAAEDREAILGALTSWARSVMPPVAWGILITLVVAAAAFYAWRRTESSVPDWGRKLFGVKRTLRHRRDLRPKASRYSAAVPAPARARF